MHQSLITIILIAIAFLAINSAVFYLSYSFTLMLIIDILLYTALTIYLNLATRHKIQKERQP